MIWANAIVQGILLGGLYALFATGLSLAFGAMRFVNLAHGDLAILAAFVMLSLSSTMSINPLYALVFVIPLAFGTGYVLQRVVFDRVIGVDPAFQIVATFGLAIVIQQGLYQHYTADTRGLDVGSLETSSIKINDTISIGWLPLITLLVRDRGARRPRAVHEAHTRSAGRFARRPTIRMPHGSWASTSNASSRSPWRSPSRPSRSPASWRGLAPRSTRSSDHNG